MAEQERIDSHCWLGKYGLAARKINLNSILPHLGFKHYDDFDPKIQKDVCSKYSENKFHKFVNRDGKVYNLISNSSMLQEYDIQLKDALEQYKERLTWATSRSNRVFGLFSHKRPVFVVDITSQDEQRRALFFNELVKLFEEQIVHTEKFNIVARSGESLFEKLTETNADSLASAVTWIKEFSSEKGTKTELIKSLQKGVEQKEHDVLCIFTENGSTDDFHSDLERFFNGKKINLSIVAYNSVDTNSLEFLNGLAVKMDGKFHAFAVTDTEEDSIKNTKSFFGGTPEGAPIDEDAFLLWNEMEETKQTIQEVAEMTEQVRKLSLQNQEKAVTETSTAKGRPMSSKPPPRQIETKPPRKIKTTEDTYLTSQQWLKKYGLEACHLDFYTFLSGHIFKHCHGVVDIKTEPQDEDSTFKTPADEKPVMVNARYCKKFVHIVWKDGEIRHVQLTGSSYRDYTERTLLLLDKIQRRMTFLKEGSRELFGTICEDRIYILIDASSSMEPKMDRVIKKLHLLLDEQIKDKKKFNIVCFNSVVTPWRTNLIDVTSSSLKQARDWAQVITTSGSTNTLDALKYAVSDKQTQGVYLLTDGRPDQPNKAIMSMLNVHPGVPIHSISFNCADRDANDFLYLLSSETGGRFHIFQDTRDYIDKEGPRPHISYDLTLLKQEYDSVKENLKVVKKLREECELLEKYVEPPPAKPKEEKVEKPKKKKKKRPSSADSRKHGNHSILSESSGLSETRKDSLRKKLKAETDDWMLQETKDLFAEEKKIQEGAREQIKKKQESSQKPSRPIPSLIGQKEESTSDWLKKNSLLASKLTLMDVLSPTVINHSATYVPILGKHVTGKVFEELLPDFYVNANKKDEIKFVNPQAVNLKEYEKNVKKKIKSFEQRLDSLIWDSLPEEVKTNTFNSSTPVSFFKHKHEMLKVLEENDWPVEEADVDLLLAEIKQGKIFLQQSTNLRKLSAEEANGSAENEEIVDEFQKFARKSRKTFPNQVVDETDNAVDDDEDLSISENQNIIEISPINKHGKYGVQSARVSQKTDQRLTTRKECLNESRGLRVITRNENDGLYYPSVIIKSESRDSAFVRFANQTESLVPTKFIIPRGGAISGPRLMRGDYVLVQHPRDPRVRFQPGVLLALPLPSEPQPQFYTTVLWNRKQLVTTRKLIFKISKERFQYSVKYIKLMEDHGTDVDQTLPSSMRVTSTHRESEVQGKIPKKLKTQTFEEAEIYKPADKYGKDTRPKTRRTGDKKPSTSGVDERDSASTVTVPTSKMSPDRRKPTETSSFAESSPEPRVSTSKKRVLKKKKPSQAAASDSESSLPRRKLSQASTISSSPETPKRDMQRSPTRLQNRKDDVVISSSESSASSEDEAKHGGVSKSASMPNATLGDESEDELIFNESTVIQSEDRPKTPLPNELNFGSNERAPNASDVQQPANYVMTETNDSVKDRIIAIKGSDQKVKFLQQLLEQSLEQIHSTEEKSGSRVREQISAMERLGANPEKHDHITKSDGSQTRVSKLQKGEEVLSKWPTDEWFYKNEVVQDMSKGYYAIKDWFDNMEILPRGEMICEEDDADLIIKKDDYVLAPYPVFKDDRFGPAKVLNVDRENMVSIEFFDKTVASTEKANIYKISFQRYANEVSSILAAMNNLIGSPAIFRSDDAKVIQIGILWDFESQSKNTFIVRDCDGELSFQKTENIYGPFRKSRPLSRGDCVLAPEGAGVKYAPATIVEVTDSTCEAKVGSTRLGPINKTSCVWITRNQYSDLYKFYRQHQPTNSTVTAATTAQNPGSNWDHNEGET